MRKVNGLRKRWLMNTVGLVIFIGLTVAIALSCCFAFFSYNQTEQALRDRAEQTTEFFDGYQNLSYHDFYRSCMQYAQQFPDKDHVELQFIDADGKIAASSYGRFALQSPTTQEIGQAMRTRSTSAFLGNSPQTEQRILSVSTPVIFKNGEIIGVFRFVIATQKIDSVVFMVTLACLILWAFVSLIAFLCTNYYIGAVKKPLGIIIDKAQKITAGSYGIQISGSFADEIGQLADAINEMSRKINQNEKVQSEFISSLSHELRTPLTAITGWSETLLNDESLDEATLRGVKIIRREAGRLTEMVVELLDFTRIQDGRMTLNIEMCDIRSEFEDTVFMYGSRLAQEEIRLEYEQNDEDIPEISCDPKRLRQVFLNILDNAAKHGGEGKRILASIHYENDQVTIQIRDFGPGIPEDEIPLVKKKFYKGSSKARGSGIGLAVCEEIVAMHAGQLILSNAQGGGTLVTIILPASQ